MKISFQIEGIDRGCTAECDLEPGDGQRPQRHERRLRPRCLHDTTSRRGGIADLPRTGLCPNRNQPRPPRGHTPPAPASANRRPTRFRPTTLTYFFLGPTKRQRARQRERITRTPDTYSPCPLTRVNFFLWSGPCRLTMDGGSGRT